MIQSINPATGAPLETFEATSAAELEAIVARAHEAFLDWRGRPLTARSTLMHAAAKRLRQGAPGYARTMALEMGKPIAQGESEIEKCAATCDYYADNAERFLTPEPRSSDASDSYVRFDPIGVVLAIMPWNFPFWQVIRFAAPALMAGNAGLLKHALNVPRCALDIEAVFRESGFPEGLFRSILVGHEHVGPLLADTRIAAVTLTGSERAGSSVAEHAGRNLKKSVLELGGSDPFIVLGDANVEKAAQTAAAARLINGGQSCIAAKRFIVEEGVCDRFLELFTKAMSAQILGDPLKRETTVGPQARRDLRDALHRQVEASIAGGAELRLGGRVPEGPGAFYPPTILTHVVKGTPAFDEEIFGPVAAVIRARGEDHAIALANDSAYGLGASLWTEDRGRAERLAARIEAGSVFVNGMVKSDPRLPFGGIKRSGFGRELSELGMREFLNAKTVWIA